MNRGKGLVKSRLGGYTIVEALIFLAVSAFMFVAAIALINGQQNKAQFVNAVHDLETRLIDLSNDMSTGYYQNGATFSCDVDPTGKPIFSNVSAGQGENNNCILVGTIVKFNDDETFDQYTVAGARKFNGTLVTNLQNAQPQALYKYTTGTSTGSVIPNAVLHTPLLYGAKVECIAIGTSPACSSSQASNAAAIGFFATLSSVGTGLNSQGGSVQSDLIFYPAANVNKTHDQSSVSTNASYPAVNYGSFLTANRNPSSGVTICLKSGTTDQYALLHLGGQTGGGNKLAVVTEIKGGSTCS